MPQSSAAPTAARISSGLSNVQGVEVRADPAAHRQLDLAGALEKLFAHLFQHLWNPVHDGQIARSLMRCEFTIFGRGQSVDRPGFGVARGLGQDRARGPYPRPGHQTLIDGLLEAERGPAGIPDGSEARHQEIPGSGRLADLEIVRVRTAEIERRKVIKLQVRVNIDQPRN